jgi:hypothetical protein
VPEGDGAVSSYVVALEPLGEGQFSIPCPVIDGGRYCAKTVKVERRHDGTLRTVRYCEHMAAEVEAALGDEGVRQVLALLEVREREAKPEANGSRTRWGSGVVAASTAAMRSDSPAAYALQRRADP